MQSFQTIMLWAADHPGWLLAFGFVLAFFEALAVVGIVLPGIFLLFLLGAVVGLDATGFALLSAAVALGAIAGDSASFWLGRRFAGRLPETWPFVRRRHWLDNGEAFFQRHGGQSIFIARFIGPLRPIVPLVAGSLNMPVSAFVPRMLLACVLWAPLMLLPGALFGESLSLAAEVGGRLTLLLIVLVLGGWGVAWLTRMVYEAGARRTPWWLKNVALWLRRHPRTQRWIGPLLEPGGREVASIVLLGLALLLSLTILLGALLAAPWSSRAWQAGYALSGLAASLRNHLTDPLFLGVSSALSPPVMFGVVAGFGIALAAFGRRLAAWHWLPATLGGALLAIALDGLMGVLLGRPDTVAVVGQVPHFGLVLASVTLGFAVLLLAREFRPRRRKWLYLGVVLALTLYGFAEFYLARATVNGLIAAAALAGGWLAIVGIGYRSRARSARHSGGLLVVLVVLWAGIASWIVPGEYAERAADHRLQQPQRQVAAEAWWQTDWQQLPEVRSRIAAEGARRFDLQFAGSLVALRARLELAGWTPAPGLNRTGLRAMLGASPRPHALPHLSRDFAGRPEQLRLRAVLASGRTALLRLWDSGMRLGPGRIPVWLGQIETLTVDRRLGMFWSWRRGADDGPALQRLLDDLEPWPARRPPGDAPWLIARPGVIENSPARLAPAGSAPWL